MKILAIECSAGPVSCAVTVDGHIVSSAFSNIKVTHSQTLMPLVENVLTSANLKIADIDVFAVANGPGSFTGIRIGIALIKGLAAPYGGRCAAVSTLGAMAERFKDFGGIICPVMDARRNQVYNALFKAENGNITRICEDRAISCDDLTKELKAFSDKIIVCGDGAYVFAPYIENNDNISTACEELLYQNATGVAAAAYKQVILGETVTALDLRPAYLRLPQAERELKERLERK